MDTLLTVLLPDHLLEHAELLLLQLPPLHVRHTLPLRLQLSLPRQLALQCLCFRTLVDDRSRFIRLNTCIFKFEMKCTKNIHISFPKSIIHTENYYLTIILKHNRLLLIFLI